MAQGDLPLLPPTCGRLIAVHPQGDLHLGLDPAGHAVTKQLQRHLRMTALLQLLQTPSGVQIPFATIYRTGQLPGHRLESINPAADPDLPNRRSQNHPATNRIYQPDLSTPSLTWICSYVVSSIR